MAVREAGGDCNGAPDDRPGQVQQGDVTVEGEGVEVRVNEDLLNLYQLLIWIRASLINGSCTHTWSVSHDAFHSVHSGGGSCSRGAL